MATYTDLLIEDEGIAVDDLGMPKLIHDRDVVLQDIKHALRESNLLEQLIGERSKSVQKLIFKKIKILVEDDIRVIAGSSEVTPENGKLHIQANTTFGPIYVGADV